MWFSLHRFPIPQFFLYPPEKLFPARAIIMALVPAIVLTSHMEEKQSMYCLKSFQEKTLSLCE